MHIEHIQIDTIAEVVAIFYKDIRDIISSKEGLESVLFTNKIVFSSDEELVEFMNRLMQFGYDDMAFDYVETMYQNIPFDFTKLNYVNKDK